MAIGRNEEFYEGDRDEVLSTGGVGETMQEVLARRWSRRGLVKGGPCRGPRAHRGRPGHAHGRCAGRHAGYR